MAWQAVQFDDAATERIKQAAAFEKRLRLESLLNIPSECGPFKLRCPTIRDLLEMEYAENALVSAGTPDISDYIQLLWSLRTDGEIEEEEAFAQYVFAKLTDEIQDQIDGFFFAQFNDMPNMGGGSVDSFSSSVWLVPLIDRLCSEYGWSVDEAMKTKIPVALQLNQRILKRNDPQYAIRNGITQQAKANELNRHNG